jgi:hypothetical protein
LPLFFHAATWANISSLRSVLLIGANLSTLGGLHKTWLAGGLHYAHHIGAHVKMRTTPQEIKKRIHELYKGLALDL